ncbi:hypothetical protein KIN20_007205 [Parelaphostrongylus tenuis]|uniref:Uncharacterized protein n=1 Tax=Parelaphostrongylus tenuis TaxID=148309 RepID=A0AAD5MP72_PARTN|nr:hypothetical protein KIN20_007205 [Parelaphostrongylus tenuis]
MEQHAMSVFAAGKVEQFGEKSVFLTSEMEAKDTYAAFMRPPSTYNDGTPGTVVPYDDEELNEEDQNYFEIVFERNGSKRNGVKLPNTIFYALLRFFFEEALSRQGLPRAGGGGGGGGGLQSALGPAGEGDSGEMEALSKQGSPSAGEGGGGGGRGGGGGGGGLQSVLGPAGVGDTGEMGTCFHAVGKDEEEVVQTVQRYHAGGSDAKEADTWSRKI